MSVAATVSDLSKTFVMHMRDGVRLPVLQGVSFQLHRGQCTVLGGPSGAGKSSVLKMLYGNYAADGGSIILKHRQRDVELVSAQPRTMLQLRRETIGYVSQFLRVVPRVGAVDIVAEPLTERGMAGHLARARAMEMLTRLNLPQRLWSLPPATFSGGEQQRVNIARGFITDHPVLLLDEPTASLDAANRNVVIDLIADKKRSGVAMLGIFHDAEVRERVADAIIDVTSFAPAKVA